VWFNDDDRVWHAKSPGDKIMMVYLEAFRTDDVIKEYKTQQEVDFRPQTCIGYIQMYCQGANVKVGDFKFKNDAVQPEYWKMFKGYLVQTIKNAGANVQQTRFMIYWDRRVCSRGVQNMMEKLGLLSDKDKKTYVFQQSDIEEKTVAPLWGAPSQFSGWNSSLANPQPVVIPPTPQPNSWGQQQNAWGLPPIGASAASNPFLKGFGT